MTIQCNGRIVDGVCQKCLHTAMSSSSVCERQVEITTGYIEKLFSNWHVYDGHRWVSISDPVIALFKKYNEEIKKLKEDKDSWRRVAERLEKEKIELKELLQGSSCPVAEHNSLHGCPDKCEWNNKRKELLNDKT